MRFQHVRIAAASHDLPDEVLTSEALEEQLAPLYERLRLHTGRLELMSGIRERRHYPPGTRPSAIATAAGARALESSDVNSERIGMFVHASVCRDFMEPATASVSHRALGLPDACEVFDLSNACLGFANALLLAAGRIERGELDAAMVVSGEDGGPLVRRTIEHLLTDPDVGKEELKLAFASLTIGSGGAACILARDTLTKSETALLGGSVLSDTSHHELCSGGVEGGAHGPLMRTDSEALLQAGNALAARTWTRFEEALGWTRDDVDRIVTHQVGVAHRRLLLSTLELDAERDFPTVETLGNIGSVSLPLSFSLARERGFIEPGQRVALLGIGSGLHCAMLGVRA